MCKGAPASGIVKSHRVTAATVPPLPHLDLTSAADANPRREVFLESSAVHAEHLCGQWIDSRGQAVSVFSCDAFEVRLRATLTTARGHKTDLSLDAIAGGGWQCGSACLVAASDAQLWWQFPNCSVSIWERGSTSHVSQGICREESRWSPPSFISQLSMDPGQVVNSEEDAGFVSSGYQSPTEAFFNPRPGSAYNSTTAFFPECCLAAAQVFVSGGDGAFGSFESAMEKESLTGQVWQKARHASGCREVQEALSNGDNHIRAAIASEMRGHIWDAVENPNANHVLQKCIVEMVPEASQFIIDELMSRNGAAKCLARHRYGCRIFERLLEHCRPDQVSEMVRDVLVEVESLCVHPFGNFVVQHLFEYGAEGLKHELAMAILSRVSKLATDLRGAAVVAKGLEYAPIEERQALAQALLREPGQLVQLATQRSGQAVVLALTRMEDPVGAEARKVLGNREAQRLLFSSRHGRTLLKAFKD